MEWIDYGLGGLSRRRCAGVGDEVTTSPISTTSSPATASCSAIEATERFYEIGTPPRLRRPTHSLLDL